MCTAAHQFRNISYYLDGRLCKCCPSNTAALIGRSRQSPYWMVAIEAPSKAGDRRTYSRGKPFNCAKDQVISFTFQFDAAIRTSICYRSYTFLYISSRNTIKTGRGLWSLDVYGCALGLLEIRDLGSS